MWSNLCKVVVYVIVLLFSCKQNYTPIIVYCDLNLKGDVVSHIIDYEECHKDVRVMLAFDSSSNLSSICSLMQDCNLFIGEMTMGYGYMEERFISMKYPIPNSPYALYVCDFSALKSKKTKSDLSKTQSKYFVKRQFKRAKALALYLSNKIVLYTKETTPLE